MTGSHGVAAEQKPPVEIGDDFLRVRAQCSVRGSRGRQPSDMAKYWSGKGIEPSYAAWEVAVLPLNYARKSMT